VIDVGSYRGSLEDLQAFVTEVWSREYQGRMSFPLWTADYFRWQFGESESASPLMLAALDGDRIVAALVGLRLPLWIAGVRRQGLLSSWLSVDPEYRGRGLVHELKSEQLRHLQQSQTDLIVSFRYDGSRVSRAAGPTSAQRRDHDWSCRRVGFWARALDSGRLAQWTLSSIDRWLTHAGAVVIPAPRASSRVATVRDYRADDHSHCLALLRQSADGFDLTIDWTDDRLDRHLGGCGVGRCLVCCEAGEIRGFVSFHVLPFSARGVEPVGIMDLVVVDKLPAREQRALINAALVQMREAGAVLALKPRLGDVSPVTMTSCGFFPRPTDSYQMVHWLTSPDQQPSLRRQQFLWR
jgi:GNAT superfamily N-acetyltransferase